MIHRGEVGNRHAFVRAASRLPWKLIAGLVLVVVPSANATNSTHLGGVCHASVFDSSSAKPGVDYRWSGSQVSVIGSKSVTFSCPIARLNLTKTPTSVEVWVTDAHTTQNISTMLVSYNEARNGWWTSSKSSSGFNSSSQKLTISVGSGISSMTVNGAMLMQVTIPPVDNGQISALHGFKVIEP